MGGGGGGWEKRGLACDRDGHHGTDGIRPRLCHLPVMLLRLSCLTSWASVSSSIKRNKHTCLIAFSVRIKWDTENVIDNRFPVTLGPVLFSFDEASIIFGNTVTFGPQTADHTEGAKGFQRYQVLVAPFPFHSWLKRCEKLTERQSALDKYPRWLWVSSITGSNIHCRVEKGLRLSLGHC